MGGEGVSNRVSVVVVVVVMVVAVGEVVQVEVVASSGGGVAAAGIESQQTQRPQTKAKKKQQKKQCTNTRPTGFVRRRSRRGRTAKHWSSRSSKAVPGRRRAPTSAKLVPDSTG